MYVILHSTRPSKPLTESEVMSCGDLSTELDQMGRIMSRRRMQLRRIDGEYLMWDRDMEAEELYPWAEFEMEYGRVIWFEVEGGPRACIKEVSRCR